MSLDQDVWMTKIAVQHLLKVGPVAVDRLVEDRQITIRSLGVSPIRYLRSEVEQIARESIKHSRHAQTSV